MRYAPWLAAGLLALTSTGWSVTDDKGHRGISLVYQQQIRRNYRDTSRYAGHGRAIVLEGTPEQIIRLSGWLDHIARVPHGHATLRAIFGSGNQVVIRHSTWALTAAGRTLAPVSRHLTNGSGEDVLILFDTRIPEQGSHHVFDNRGEPLEFTALQNLFHELAHARHQVNGTWRYWDSEGQAIEEENRFRSQFAVQQGHDVAGERSGMAGRQLWWPATRAARASW